ncbi:cytochrome c oxidase subunit 4 [Blastococcus brunescens]|uniref:Cytochrome c oxidase polypeptide 4 n=1 Tax=Blastococcus brunescens TaxID=1564165 RepID=A0ABZ1B5H0_9ACTN|nr:cytochrome c oxidase subunit 4 [Blastococcus sp. BMG 8361]WRL65984.1 cytochrome c oxidase subunit 4 [Blastococcus sp. BMG 8361]
MKVEALIFNIIALFCVIAAVVYGFWAREPIGTTALALSGGLTGLIGGFFWFVSRRIDARPEDRKDADIADGAGELGFFPPASYWPFALALSAALMGLGLAFFYSWLILIAAAALLITIGGLLFEYYVGQNATQS